MAKFFWHERGMFDNNGNGAKKCPKPSEMHEVNADNYNDAFQLMLAGLSPNDRNQALHDVEKYAGDVEEFIGATCMWGIKWTLISESELNDLIDEGWFA